MHNKVRPFARLLDKKGHVIDDFDVPHGKPYCDHVEMLVKDAGGRIKYRNKFRMKSFLVNWLVYTRAWLEKNNGGYYTGTAYGGGNVNIYNSYGFTGEISETGTGIVVGTDDGSLTSLALDNNALGAIIVHGESAGELYYHQSVVDYYTSTATGYRIRLRRHFTNRSGGTITVKEAGIRQEASNALMARDLEDDSGPISVAIANGEVLEVRYMIDYPEDEGWTQNLMKGYKYVWGDGKGMSGVTYDRVNGSTYGLGSTEVFSVHQADEGEAHGIVTGTSDTALGKTDISLGSQVANGVTTDTMYHHDYSGFTGVNNETSSANIQGYRVFSNLSGASITVREMGIYGELNSNVYTMSMRNLLGDISVPDEHGLLVGYKFMVTL